MCKLSKSKKSISVQTMTLARSRVAENDGQHGRILYFTPVRGVQRTDLIG